MTESQASTEYQLTAEAAWFYYDHPAEFVREIIGVEPDEHQIRAFQTIVDGFWPVIFSGQGVGKTAFLSWLVQWWEYTRPTCKIPVTSTKKEQLADNLWPEIKKWLDHSKVGVDFEWQKTKVFLKNREETCFAVARTASTQEALQGFHDDHLLFIVEEASGVEEIVFEPVLGSLTNEGAVVVMVGNRTRSSGFFFNAFTKPTGKFRPIHIPCVDSEGKMHPRVSADYPESVSEIYGRNSNQYRVRVLGLPPTSDDDSVIPWEWVNDAVEADLQPSDHYKIIWGVDVATRGDDRTCVAKRQGNCLLEPIAEWRKLEGTQIAGRITLDYHDLPDEKKPDRIYVDSIGAGDVVVSILRQNGLPVTGIAVSTVPSSKEKFHRLRDELWWRGREWFQGRNVSISAERKVDSKGAEGLVAELSTPRFIEESTGKIKVESKKDFKKRLYRIGSPDKADAFLLTLAGGVDKVVEQRERHPLQRGYHEPQGTWQSV